MNSIIIEYGLSRFQSPSFLLHLKALWTWAALIIAAIATFNSLIRRSKRMLLRIHKGKSVISLPPPSSSTFDDDEFYFSSSEADESDEEDDELVESSESEKDFGDFEGIQGKNGESEKDFAWPELARDGSVVKLWSDPVDEIRAVHVASPALVFLAGKQNVEVWDTRVGGVGPAVRASATWQAEEMGRVVRIGREDYGKVYVGDDVGRVRVVDLRNVRMTSAESWCRNAARCLNN